MRRRLIRMLATVAATGASWFAAGEAYAAPTKIRFLDVDSASHNSFVGVYGSGFGAAKGTVAVGGATADDVPLWTDTLIIARVPTGAQTGVVEVTPQGGQLVESDDTLGIHAGSVYVVSTAGDDTAAGDESAPFQSLHKAMSVLQPGDTVLILAGTYDEQDPDPGELPALFLRAQQPATLDRPVTWRGFGADMPVVRGTGSKAKTSPVLYAAADHVRLARLQIDGAFNSASAVQVQATGVWLVGLQIYGFGQHGIGVGNVPDTFIAGNLIRDGGTRPNLDHGIWVTGQGARIRDNVVTDLPNGYGIFLQYQTQSSARVFANVVRNVAGGGIGLSRVKGGNHIYNNIVWSVGTSQGCRCAVEVAYGKLGGEPSTEDRVYFNTFLGPGFTGLFLADRDGSVQLHGNVFADFRVGIRVDDEVSTAALASSHNLWYRADEPPQFKWAGPWLDYTQFQNESDQERPSLLADPKLVDPAAGDAHLAPGSPAIDVGGGPDLPEEDFEGNPRPKGAALDIGAYEYLGASGGAGGTAGTAGAGGASGSGGGAGGTGPDGGARDNPAPNDDDGRGCGCSVPGGNGGSGVGWGLTLAAVAGTWRRRRSVP